MYGINDLNITNVRRFFVFHISCRENHRGAINFKPVFGVVKDLDPLVSWKLDRARDLSIQADKLLTFWDMVRYF